MSEMEMTTDAETEIKDFTDELSDEALDRETAASISTNWFCRVGN